MERQFPVKDRKNWMKILGRKDLGYRQEIRRERELMSKTMMDVGRL